MADDILENNNSGNDEDICLSGEEMDSILGSAEISEVDFHTPEVPSTEDDASDDGASALADTDVSLDDTPDVAMDASEPDDGQSIDDSLPSVDLNQEAAEMPADEGLTEGKEVILEEEELPSLDADLPEIESEASTGKELPSLDEDLPSLDEDLPSLDEDLPSLDEDLPSLDEDLPSLDADLPAPDEVTPLDEGLPSLDDAVQLPESASAGQMDISPQESETTGDADEDAIALSSDEMDNILSDVDDSQVLDLGTATDAGESEENVLPAQEEDLSRGLSEADESSDIVSVSGEEIDSIVQDIDEIPEDTSHIARSTEIETDGEKLNSESIDDSLDFEQEIMKEADVVLEKPSSVPKQSEERKTDAIAPNEADSSDPAEAKQDTNIRESSAKDSSVKNDSTSDKISSEPEEITSTPNLEEIEDLPDLDEIDQIDQIDELQESQTLPEPDFKEDTAFDGTITEDDIKNAVHVPDIPETVKTKPAKTESVKDSELADLFRYLDVLLDHLPDEKIKEFAESKYYDKYISIINKLGI